MKEYFKFPTTRYLTFPNKGIERNDKLYSVDEMKELLRHQIIVEEKVDGANLGISFNTDGELCLQNRGNWLDEPYTGQWRTLGGWLAPKVDLLFETLFDRYILFGEWCYAVHSVYYSMLPDLFIAFDVFDKLENKFFSVNERNKMLKNLPIVVVHQCGKGVYSLKDLEYFFDKSFYGEDLCEGIYIRQDEGKWLKHRAKMVRKEFQQCISEHWSKKELKLNKVKWLV
ncbi:MAG: RNA ligase family protein [Lachnospiraceae bacterium]|nr:RNA ligase family protein [Lachnospiraceae bacterium]